MAVLVDGKNGGSERESAWRDLTPDPFATLESGSSPDFGRGEMYQMDVSLREQQLLLRLRMLEAGEFRLVVLKAGRGMVGLREWRVESGEALGG